MEVLLADETTNFAAAIPGPACWRVKLGEVREVLAKATVMKGKMKIDQGVAVYV